MTLFSTKIYILSNAFQIKWKDFLKIKNDRVASFRLNWWFPNKTMHFKTFEIDKKFKSNAYENFQFKIFEYILKDFQLE